MNQRIASLWQQAHPLLLLCLLGLVGLTLLSAGRAVSKTADSATGGLDFHPFWYNGQAWRQGQNPYRAFIEQQEPSLPIHYLVGVPSTTPPLAQPGLAKIPTNTAPLFLLLSPLAHLSWPFAKWTWLFINLVLLLSLPTLIIKRLPQTDSVEKLFIYLAIFSFTSTRVAAWLGQTTFLVLVLLLLAFHLRERRPWLAGILLGLALSKYSLALPLVLFLVWGGKRRNWLVLFTSFAVQLLGLLIISLVSGDTPWQIGQHYWLIFQRVANSSFSGIQLSILFPDSAFGQIIVPILLTVLVFGLLVWQRYKIGNQTDWLVENLVFSILMLWTLLVAYHGVHDLVAVALLFTFIPLITRPIEIWQLSKQGKRSLMMIVMLLFGVFLLPGNIVAALLNPTLGALWLRLFDYAHVFALFLLLSISFWLLIKLPVASIERYLT